MAAQNWGFPVIDIDSHVYEPEDIWERYVPGDYRAAARSAFWHGLDDQGNALTILNGVTAKEMNRSKLVRQAIWRPGMTVDDIGEMDPNTFQPLNPGASDPEARLADMDALGIDQTIVYPTLFAEYFPLVENPDVADVLARAYNDWIWDFCQAAPERLHPVAVLPLQSLLFARRELDRVSAKGFRAIFLRPMFYTGGASGRGVGGQAAGGEGQGARGAFIESPHFEPLWRQLDALGCVACIHSSNASTNPEGTSAGTFIERVSQRMNIGHSVAETVAHIQDAGVFLTAACFHGLMEDFPKLKMCMAHAGATMAPLVLEKAETYLWLAFGNILGGGKPVSLEPDRVFEEHPFLLSFDGWEASVARMPDVFERKANWGSRYPHHDASSPAEAIEMLEKNGVDKATIERLMGGNAIELFDLKAKAPA
jgi:predicted TIM-barrel fold metal-dependent hydrolase